MVDRRICPAPSPCALSIMRLSCIPELVSLVMVTTRGSLRLPVGWTPAWHPRGLAGDLRSGYPSDYTDRLLPATSCGRDARLRGREGCEPVPTTRESKTLVSGLSISVACFQSRVRSPERAFTTLRLSRSCPTPPGPPQPPRALAARLSIARERDGSNHRPETPLWHQWPECRQR